MDEVLVLGNGISRLGKDDMVRTWPGEVWGCNRAYEEFPDKLSRLTGHTEVLREAIRYQGQHPSARFELWSGHVGKPVEGGTKFTCPTDFLRDSGTTLVAQALEEGRSVAVLGFDLGGWDIHSPGIEKNDKTEWVKRWRKIIEHYGSDRIRFIGHDHMPFLLSDKDASAYSVDYLFGIPHIIDPEYLAAWERHTGRSSKIITRRSVMVRVRFANGYEGDMNETLAAIHKDKGLVEIIDETAEAKPDKKSKKK